MSDLLDLQVTELLCSRLCHELASPIGAINNGIEMIEEFDESMMPEAMPLIGSSARLVADRLMFYRMAYGLAGTRSVASDSEVRDLAESFLSDGRCRLDWPQGGVTGDLREGWGKLLLNLLPLAAESLPRGGSIGYRSEDGGDRLDISVVAQGQGARITEECLAALSNDVAVDELTPRSVHAFFLARLAARLGGGIAVDGGAADRLTLSVTLVR